MIRKAYVTVLMAAICLIPMQAAAEDGAEGGSQAGVVSDRIARVQGQNTSFVRKVEAEQPKQQEVQKHEVVAGDTLWDLSSQYLADPFMWPALWSFNPQVTNPHWIYPGDTIYLEPKPDAVVATIAPENVQKPGFKMINKLGSGIIRIPGFYITELPETRGHILYSDQEKHMISVGDQVQVDWVDIEMRKKTANGQRFTVFKQSKPVLNEDGDEMAYKLVRQGEIQLIDKQEDTLSTAEVTQASREIERGMLIIPNEDLVYSVKVSSNGKSMEGRIIDTIDVISQIASEQFVIINRGASDGVAAGNHWTVFEQREGLGLLAHGEETRSQYGDDYDEEDLRNGRIEREDEQTWVLGHEVEMHQFPEPEEIDEVYSDREYTTADLPLRKIGDIVVVDVRDKFCTGLIVSSSREMNIDTRVVMIKD